MWYKSNFFKYTVAIIFILLIINLLIQVKPILDVIIDFISSFIFPIIFAVILYYFLRPLRRYMEKYKVPRLAAIIIIYVTILTCFSILITLAWPTINHQITEFAATPQEKIKEVENKTIGIMNIFNFTAIPQEELRDTLIYYLKQAFNWITTDIILTISSITKIASYFIITPFILFYLLKDDGKLEDDLVAISSPSYTKRTKKLLLDIDVALSDFITSQFIVAAIIGALIFLGYSLIGLKYAVLLALIAMVFNLIPFCGPFISTIPALVIGFSQGPWMSLKVILVVIVVHLLDLNLISPRVVGQRLRIHPITIILLLIASASTFGFWSLFLAVPIYAVLKILFRDLAEMKKESTEEST